MTRLRSVSSAAVAVALFGVLLLWSSGDSPEREAHKAVGPRIEQARTAEERATELQVRAAHVARRHNGWRI